MKLTTKIIADKVIKVTGCDIRLSNRKREVVKARWIYAKLCRNLLTSNLKSVGKEIGKDHATIIHYHKLIENPNYFKIDSQTAYLELKEYFVREYNLKPLESVKSGHILLKQFKEKDKSYTQLLLKYNQLKIELKDSREDNQRLIEKNLKLSLNI